LFLENLTFIVIYPSLLSLP
jgi:hypothetical protein